MSYLVNHFVGSLVGVHAGDALGAPYEKRGRTYIAADFVKRDGLVPHDYPDPWNRDGIFPAGRPTDDSELTAALAQSLIDSKGSNPAHQYEYFKRAVDGESFVWDGKASGFGGTTRKMLVASSYEEALLLPPEERPCVASNGSLMRSAPLALWFHSQPEHMDEATEASSRVTHIHETAVASCLVYVRFLDELLHGRKREVAWDRVVTMCKKDMRVRSAASVLEECVEQPPTSNSWMNKGGPAGSALHTLHIAVWCTLSAVDFQDGIEKAVLFAGDTDTAAAVTGGLLGAHYGIEGIPAPWRAALKGYERMVALATDIYEYRPK